MRARTRGAQRQRRVCAPPKAFPVTRRLSSCFPVVASLSVPLPCPSRPLGCGRERPPCFWPWFGRGAVACVHAPPRPVGTPHHLSRGGGPCRMGSLPSHSSLQEGDHGDEEAQVATLTTGGERGRETPVQAAAWLETVTWLFCCGPAAGCGPSAWWWCEGWRLENGGAGPGSLLRPRPLALGPRGTRPSPSAFGSHPLPGPLRSRCRSCTDWRTGGKLKRKTRGDSLWNPSHRFPPKSRLWRRFPQRGGSSADPGEVRIAAAELVDVGGSGRG